MSTDKGGSDLDVFNDLKPQTPDGTPILETKKTLMGLQAPADGAGFPPVPGSSPSSSGSSRSIPPPPPSQRPRRSVVGLARPDVLKARDEDERADDTSPGLPPEPRSATGASPGKESFGLDSWAMTQPRIW